MKNKVEIVGIIFGVILFIIIVSGATYAFYSWASDPNTGFISGDSQCFDIVYTKGVDVVNGSLSFGTTYAGGLNTKVKVKTKDTCTINGIGTLYLDTLDETSDYLINNRLIRYQVLENTTEVNSGIVTSKGKNIIYNNFDINNIEKEFTIYIWIDINDVTSDNISTITASTYSGAVSMSAEGR